MKRKNLHNSFNVIWIGYLEGFKRHLLLERSLSKNTVIAYINDLEHFLIFLLEYHPGKTIPEVNYIDIESFISYLFDIELSGVSASRAVSGLKSFFRYLVLEGVLEDDPSDLIQTPRAKKKLPEVLTYGEVQNVFSSIDLSTNHGLRNRAILETLYACGLRVTELINLLISNLHLDLSYIKVSGKGNKERLIPIGPSAVKYIRQYQKFVRQHQIIDPEYLDHLYLNKRGRKLSRTMIFYIIKEATTKAEISKNVSPHTFRHSFATHLIEGGANLRAVQLLLGHESIITSEIYTHLDQQYLRDTLMTFHPHYNKKD